MSISVLTNVASLSNRRNLNSITKRLRDSFDRLSAGKLTKASQDAAGMALAMALSTDASVSSVASRNISDGVSAANIADGAMESAGAITGRMSELAAQASNGTLSDTQRQALDAEYQDLRSELDRISQTTEFNGQQLLSGGSTDIQVGTDGSGSNGQTISIDNPEISASSLGLTDNLLSQESAQNALDQSKAASSSIASARGDLGATVNRLGAAYENLQSKRVNELDAASRIQDIDVAQETATLAKLKIGQNISAGLSAQANLQPSIALKLLNQ